jgi:hypothetical protein
LLRNLSVARLKKVDLQNAGQMIWNHWSNKKGGVLTVRMDSPDGPVITAIRLDGDDKWKRQYVEFPVQSGVHDVYFTYHNPTLSKDGEEFAAVFDWFTFMESFPGKGMAGWRIRGISELLHGCHCKDGGGRYRWRKSSNLREATG